jgi:hypothetical protein
LYFKWNENIFCPTGKFDKIKLQTHWLISQSKVR